MIRAQVTIISSTRRVTYDAFGSSTQSMDEQARWLFNDEPVGVSIVVLG